MAIIKRPDDMPDHHRPKNGPVGFLRRLTDQSTILFGIAGILFGVGTLILMEDGKQDDQQFANAPAEQHQQTPYYNQPYTPQMPHQNGQHTSPDYGNPTWAAQATVITRDIAAGEKIRHRGPLIIEGAVGADARIRVSNGPLLIKGDVGSGSSIRVSDGISLFWSRDWQSGWGHYDQDKSWKENWQHNWSAFRQDLREGRFWSNQTNLTITGTIGKDVKLKSDQSIAIANAGPDLKAEAGASFSGREIGSDSEITAGNRITLMASGGDGKITAGNSIRTGTIGNGSQVRAGNSIQASDVGQDSDLAAGNSINARYVGAEVTASAGNSIHANGADPTAELNAGSRVIIGKMEGAPSTAEKPEAEAAAKPKEISL